jgi:hypothetical protein
MLTTLKISGCLSLIGIGICADVLTGNPYSLFAFAGLLLASGWILFCTVLDDEGFDDEGFTE